MSLAQELERVAQERAAQADENQDVLKAAVASLLLGTGASPAPGGTVSLWVSRSQRVGITNMEYSREGMSKVFGGPLLTQSAP